MHEEIQKLLDDIRYRPGVFLGKKTLNGLSSYVYGYIHCMHVRDNIEPKSFEGFQEFVEKHYDLHDNIHSNRHWSNIIEFFNPIEEEAFDEFYKLLDEFVKK